MTTRTGLSSLAAILVAGGAFFAIVGAASADVTIAQREACTPDALRLCSHAIPDVGRVTACMQANKANLSARCRAAFPADPVQQASAPRVVRERVQVASTKTHTVSTRHVTVRTHRTTVAVATPVHSTRRHHRSVGSFGGGFGAEDIMGMMSGSRQMTPDQAMGMARQILTTYRAACGSGSIPSEYCAY